MTRLSSLRGTDLQRDVPLAKYTAARLGGQSDWLYIAKESTERLVEVVQAAWDDNIPVRILGGGANVLVSDAGFRGLIIINRVSDIQFGNWHDGRNVSATGGTGLLRLARECAVRGIAGMEWAVGVPGTVGGAVVNNAGAHSGTMADSVADVVVLEYGKGAQLYTNADLRYDYRHSILKSRSDKRFIVLLATFILPTDDSQTIKQKMDKYNAYRKCSQPSGASLGSIFKNPSGDFAGRLIEIAGLKAYRIGGVEVSQKHANFFVNTGESTANDYYALIRHVQKTVLQKQGIELELEIELLGDF
ncbi:MAG: UDP-N-acetylmuramate dehydrogenase [Anaerolineae bacterium]|nr:UDP-N-acetylmuramate dehydrogenase [Anaerolineae bacterium]